MFYLRGVAPAIVKTLEIYRGAAVFIVLQLIGLAIAGTFPSLVNYLPNRVYLGSETAPPPMNPKLQHCLEEYVFAPIRRERRRASCPHRSGPRPWTPASCPTPCARSTRAASSSRGRPSGGRRRCATRMRRRRRICLNISRCTWRCDGSSRICASCGFVWTGWSGIARGSSAMRPRVMLNAGRWRGEIAEVEAEMAAIEASIPAAWGGREIALRRAPGHPEEGPPRVSAERGRGVPDHRGSAGADRGRGTHCGRSSRRFRASKAWSQTNRPSRAMDIIKAAERELGKVAGSGRVKGRLSKGPPGVARQLTGSGEGRGVPGRGARALCGGGRLADPRRAGAHAGAFGLRRRDPAQHRPCASRSGSPRSRHAWSRSASRCNRDISLYF